MFTIRCRQECKFLKFLVLKWQFDRKHHVCFWSDRRNLRRWLGFEPESQVNKSLCSFLFYSRFEVWSQSQKHIQKKVTAKMRQKNRLDPPQTPPQVLHDQCSVGPVLVTFQKFCYIKIKNFHFSTSNQCYKHLTGLYLQVCKSGLFLKSFVAISIV